MFFIESDAVVAVVVVVAVAAVVVVVTVESDDAGATGCPIRAPPVVCFPILG